MPAPPQRQLSIFNQPWPLPLAQLFPQPQPLIAEFGFGNGDFLLHLSRSHPDCNIIGFEISSQSLDKAEAKIARRRLRNVRVLHAKAEAALAHLLPPQSLRLIHINYPDPWFKKRHSRRRLLQRDTVDWICSRLAPGGQLQLATDIAAYAQMAHELLAATPCLRNVYAQPWRQELPGRFRTKYELKAARESRPAHYFCYARNALPAPDLPLIQELHMPHVFLHSPLAAAELVTRFTQTRRSAAGTHIAILRAYADPARDTAVFEAVIDEPRLEQHVLLSLSPRQGAGQYIVKLTGVGHARPTAGVHLAVAALAEWVASLHEDARVLEWKLRG